MPNTIKPDEVEEALASIENQENQYNHREVLLSIKEGPGTSGYTPKVLSRQKVKVQQLIPVTETSPNATGMLFYI